MPKPTGLKKIAFKISDQIENVCNGKIKQCGCLKSGAISDPFKSCMVWAPLIISLDSLDLKSTADLQAIYFYLSRTHNYSIVEIKSFLEAYLEHELEAHKSGPKTVYRKKWEKLLKISRSIPLESFR